MKGRIHRVLAWRSLPHGAAVLLAVLTLAVGAGLLFARPQKTVEAQAGWPVTEVTMALPAGRPAGTLPLALPEGWQVGENGVIATADGTGVGAVMLGMTMDLPEDLPREDDYKAAMAELRLSRQLGEGHRRVRHQRLCAERRIRLQRRSPAAGTPGRDGV